MGREPPHNNRNWPASSRSQRYPSATYLPDRSLDKSYIACQETDPATGDTLSLIYKPIVERPNGVKEITTRIYLKADLQ